MTLPRLDHLFARPELLWALLALPLLALLRAAGRGLGRQRLARLGRRETVLTLLPERRPWRRLAAGLSLNAGLALLAIAAAGPRGGAEDEPAAAEGRDVMVALDLSRSMWASDALPNRFEAARQALRGLADAVEKRGGHRLGLVIFAARAKLACPLTQDLDHFRQVVAELPATGPPPDLLPTDAKVPSGTRIGAGLRAAVESFDARRPGCRDVLLISDGDDPADDGEWQAGVRAAQQAGVAVFAVGLGDPSQGGRIPVPGGFLMHNGQDVWSRLTEEPLATAARLTGGAYLAAKLDPPPLGKFLRDDIEPRGACPMDADLLPQPRGRQGWFFAGALALLALWLALSDPPGHRQAET
jgi:Ca-activated chloride channel family protein